MSAINDMPSAASTAPDSMHTQRALFALHLSALALLATSCSSSDESLSTSQEPIACEEDKDCPQDSVCEASLCVNFVLQTCTLEAAPVCGTDEQTYGNLCFAENARVEIAYRGACGEPCDGPGPAGCIQAGCPQGEFCVPSEPLDVCTPSSCVCGDASNVFECTEDCDGGTCVEAISCDEPNPAGCTQEECDDGFTCVTDPDTCAPSECECDEDTATWTCAVDCEGGGTCQPDAPQE